MFSQGFVYISRLCKDHFHGICDQITSRQIQGLRTSFQIYFILVFFFIHSILHVVNYIYHLEKVPLVLVRNDVMFQKQHMGTLLEQPNLLRTKVNKTE